MANPYVIESHDSWILTEKPAGLLSVPGKGPEKADCLYSRLQRDFPDILVVHRLDQPTSGLMIWARNKEAQKKLGHQFEQRLIHKEYQALLSSGLPREEGGLELRQRLDVDNRPLQIIDEEKGKLSLTRWRLLGEESGGHWRVQLYPETGRTHQLRLHMAAMKAPILGDSLYGGPPFYRMALHACVLEFLDPVSGCLRHFESVVPF